MIFQYKDEDSGAPVQMSNETRQSLLCKEKIDSSNRCLDVISWDYDNIAAAVLRHAEFS